VNVLQVPNSVPLYFLSLCKKRAKFQSKFGTQLLGFSCFEKLQVPNVSPLRLSSVIFGASAFVEDLNGRKEQSVDRKGPGLKWFLFQAVWTLGTINRGNRDCNFLECEVSRFD